jgi:acetyl esterase
MEATPGWRDRLEIGLARLLCSLPPRLQVRLSGQPPIVIDGQTLAPDIQLLLAMIERFGSPSPETLPVEESRALRRRVAIAANGHPTPVKSVSDLTIEGPARPLKARHYVPDEPGGPHPLLVYYHGGGWTICDLDTHDELCRLIAVHAGVHVLSIDYRLGPEEPFPAAVDDAIASFEWAAENAERLGADPERVCVGGDSAGGNLSTVVCQQTRASGRSPFFQLLIYPGTDASTDRPSKETCGQGFMLTRAEMDWFIGNYLHGVDVERADPRLSPLCAEDLSGLPPALVVTAGFDPLRDEGEAYAEALNAAGSPATLRRFPSLIHAFVNLTNVSPSSRDAVLEIAGATRAMVRPTVLEPA